MATVWDLSRVQRTIREMLDKLQVVKSEMRRLEHEIDRLSTDNSRLCRNLEYLKRDHIISLASEYKKIKLDIVLIQKELKTLRKEREEKRTQFSNMEHTLRGLRRQLELFREQVGKDNLISIDFRRRKW